MDEREYKIIIQNLLNRAVETELHNALLEDRVVDYVAIRENLSEFKKILGEEIKKFNDKKGK